MIDIPQVGLGTWKSKPGDVKKAVKVAVGCGYRHIDCASYYMNEAEVGEALQEVLKDGKVKREDLFITGKLNNPYHRKEHVQPHLKKTLKDLRLDYLDLYLMHWPVAFNYVPFDENKTGADMYAEGDDPSKAGVDWGVSVQETWRAMEDLVDKGLVKHIGVSNFPCALLFDLLTYAKIRPACLQVESHPYCQQPNLKDFCTHQDIAYTAYSPLGSGDYVVNKEDEELLLEDSTLKRIADKHDKTPALVALRWAVQRGTIVIPKSVTPERIKQNLSVLDWKLDDDDMKDIRAIDRNHHYIMGPGGIKEIPLFLP